MDFKELINQITRDHPDWTLDQVKAELYQRLIKESPAYLDDSHCFPEVTLTDKDR